MTFKVIAVAIMSILLAGISYGADSLYTWIDDKGVLNITDQYPPEGAQIIDVSPSYREDAEKIEQERLSRKQMWLREQEEQKINKELLQQQKVEAEQQKKADELYQQAVLENNKKGTRRTRRWARRKAEKDYLESQQASEKAEEARKQVEALEE